MTNQVRCEICNSEIEIEEAQEVLNETFVCDPELIAPQCLWYWNEESYMKEGDL